MIRPTLRQLSYLTALADEQSFGKAAQYCLVTQSTLSAGIKDLENILQQQLVHRSGRQITLTPFGDEVAEQSRKILIDIDAITARSQQMKEILSGPLRLGVIPTIAPYLLPHIIPHLKSRFPNLELQLFEDLSAKLVEQAHQGKLDIILLAFPYNTRGLECHDLFDEPFYLASPNTRKVPDKLRIKDLRPEDMLLLDDGHCLRDHALRACNLQIPKTMLKTFSATSLATLTQMVGHGYGVTLLPEMVVRHAPMPQNIIITPFVFPPPTRKIGVAWKKNSPNMVNLSALFDVLLEFFVEADKKP